MKNISVFRAPAIISLLLVIPLLVLELINQKPTITDFPVVLFVTLWVVPFAFILIFMSLVRSTRTNGLMSAPFLFLIKYAGLLLLAWFWVSVVLDQIPCFLGIPNCD